jgi:general secretion pathway protein A
MFLDHFGLREQPFGVTPDPHFLYFSPSHLEALASLFYGIQTQRGFMALIAKPGMGKTTLLFHLLERLRGSARTAFLFQSGSDPREFLRSLIADLGIDAQDDDLGRMHRKLNEVLIREVRAGRRVVVVIDEAQNLEDSVLEAVRLLSNFEIPGTKLMQILLAGQPQLADKLASVNLVQLRQRISILSQLKQFSASETADYIGHRLRVAGYRGKSLFTTDALAIIHSRSEGIPRNINNLCFHASTLAFANGQKIIDTSILNEVLEDLDMEMLGSVAANNTAAEQQAEPRSTVDPASLAERRDYVNPRWIGQDIISGNIKLVFCYSAEDNAQEDVCVGTHSLANAALGRSQGDWRYEA